VAGRHGAFGIGEKLDPKIVLRDAELLAGATAEDGFAGVPFGHKRAQGAFGVLFDDVLNARQPRVIVRMKVDAEKARQQGAKTQLQTPDFHVADQLTDDGLPADSRWGKFLPAVR